MGTVRAITALFAALESAAAGQRIYAVHRPFPGVGEFAQRGGSFVWAAER